MDKLDLSIIIPCFNEEDNVQSFYKKVQNVLWGGLIEIT